MARSHLRHIVHSGGPVIRDAVVEAYTDAAATVPVTDMYAAKTGGDAITELTSNAQGEVEAWFDEAKTVYLKVTDGGDPPTAYHPLNPGVLLPFSDFVEEVEVLPPPGEIITVDGGTMTGPLTVADGGTELSGQDPTLRIRREIVTEDVSVFRQGQLTEFFVDLPDTSQETYVAGVFSPATGEGSTMNLTSGDVALGCLQATLKHQGSGSISHAVGLRTRMNFDTASGVGEVTNWYGVLAKNPRNRDGSGADGTIVNNYGLYVEDQDFGENNIGLYIAGASSYALQVATGISLFQDTVEIQKGTGLALEVWGQGVGTAPVGAVASYSNTLADAPELQLRRARGTRAAPTLVSNTATLGAVRARAYDGSAYAAGPAIRYVTTEDWSSSAHGSRIAFDVINNAATTPTEVLRVRYPAADGDVALVVGRNASGTVSVQAVTVGAADSGGTGFRLLRVAN